MILSGIISINLPISRATVGIRVSPNTANQCVPPMMVSPNILPIGNAAIIPKTKIIIAALAANDWLFRMDVLKTDFGLRTWKMCMIEVQPQIRNAIVCPTFSDGATVSHTSINAPT